MLRRSRVDGRLDGRVDAVQGRVRRLAVEQVSNLTDVAGDQEVDVAAAEIVGEGGDHAGRR